VLNLKNCQEVVAKKMGVTCSATLLCVIFQTFQSPYLRREREEEIGKGLLCTDTLNTDNL
jgi:hypothetical protein